MFHQWFIVDLTALQRDYTANPQYITPYVPLSMVSHPLGAGF
jgi:hypothetical protein